MLTIPHIDKYQTKLLDEAGVGTLHRVEPNKIHDSVHLVEAWYDPDNQVLVFFNTGGKDRYRLLYYTGNERDSNLTLLYRGVAVYEDVHMNGGYLSEEEYTTPTFDEEEDDGEP
jgi:hypothetical protein